MYIYQGVKFPGAVSPYRPLSQAAVFLCTASPSTSCCWASCWVFRLLFSQLVWCSTEQVLLSRELQAENLFPLPKVFLYPDATQK